ncbi:hypothetical protein [Larkinella knui]|uniref:Uncharacterized protein n=1 Tax=Larkinella knui TaxID=2025310 RepID=A0A3P1CAM3_9BACT|nr:hypothetical protein [Larkinella knui]RRB10280.1 hypothetical protein EHT87_29040 [Larkinella knui]
MEQNSFASGKLTPLQLHMLKTFDRKLTEEQEKEVKQLIADYFFRLADNEIDEIVTQKRYTTDDFEKMAHGHRRRPYRPTEK